MPATKTKIKHVLGLLATIFAFAALGEGVDQSEVERSLMAARQQAGPETMKSQLQALSFEDPSRVFIVRRINKLGFASSGQLRLYFSRYGEVKSVHVSHSRVKSLRTSERGSPVQWRLRAAALGFVVMCSKEAVEFILQDGPEHEVNFVLVRVHPFHRHSNTSESEAIGPDAPGSGVFQDEECGDLPHEQIWPLGMPPPPEMPGEGPLAYGLCDGNPLGPGLMYVSEQDLQDAMPAQYED